MKKILYHNPFFDFDLILTFDALARHEKNIFINWNFGYIQFKDTLKF
jgi:hypothetical protein